MTYWACDPNDATPFDLSPPAGKSVSPNVLCATALVLSTALGLTLLYTNPPAPGAIVAALTPASAPAPAAARVAETPAAPAAIQPLRRFASLLDPHADPQRARRLRPQRALAFELRAAARAGRAAGPGADRHSAVRRRPGTARGGPDGGSADRAAGGARADRRGRDRAAGHRQPRGRPRHPDAGAAPGLRDHHRAGGAARRDRSPRGVAPRCGGGPPSL